jgi:hypothetical protein
VENIPARGAGNGAPKPNIRDQADPTGPGGKIEQLPTRSTSTPSVIDLVLTNVTSMSSVWTNRWAAFRGTRQGRV